MKTIKKILCSLLVVVMCLTSAPLGGFVGLELPDFSVSEWFGSKASATETYYREGYYTYTVIDGKAIITDVDESISGKITIPSEFGEYDVTTIGGLAFYGCTSLTNVIIPASVTTIGDISFSCCSSLTSITIPNSVTKIGDGVFSNCTRLTSVTIPNSVTIIGDDMFRNCSSLISITVPDSVTSIGDYAFWFCESLETLTIGDSVTTIGDQAFRNCSSLTNLTIPNCVITIGEDAFSYCSSLTNITIGNCVERIGDFAFYGCNNLVNVTIPDSVTTIGGAVFSNCDSLTNVTIGKGVTSIGWYAFQACSLTSVTIGNRVASIGEGAFSDCKNLTNVYYDGTEEQWNKISIGSDNECLINAIIHYQNDPSIPDNPVGTITPDYIKKNYFLQQHLDFITNKNSNWYNLATGTLRFAGDIWENVEGGFGRIAAEFAYDVIEGSLEVIFLQWFDGLDCLENVYDAILLDYLASSSTTISLKNTLENDISVICVKIINDLLKICQSDTDWANDMDILSEIKSLVSISDYSENKLYKVLEKMLKGKGTGFIDGIFKTFECFGKVSDVLNVGLSTVDYFVEMMKYTAAIEAYYNSSLAYKEFLSKLADEVENVTIYGDAGEKFREAYENYASCVNYTNVAENIIEHRKEKGKTFIQNLSQGILSKTTLTLATKMFGLSKAAAVKFNAALWAADAGFAISNMLTGNDTIVNCRRLLRANHILDVASYNVMKDYEFDLKYEKSYNNAELFDFAFTFYKNVQLYSLNTYKKHCETSSTKPLSFRKKYFKNELEETVGRIKVWNNIVCHVDFDTELVSAGMMGIHTAVIACPTDIYVYRKSDNQLVACVVDNVSKQYSDEVEIICVGEEKALACNNIDDYIVEIVATGNGTMDVIYNAYSDLQNIVKLNFDDIPISSDYSYSLDYDNQNIKREDGVAYKTDGTIDNCSCKCHGTSFFTKFIWKITLFFNKIFKKNKECTCGIYHY